MVVDRRVLFVLVALALVISPAYAASFETDQLLIKTLVKSGESITIPVKITNTDFNSDSFSITSSKINDLLEISESKFNLDPGQTKNIDLRFRSQPNSPGVFTGKLNIVSGSKRVTLPLVLEVESRNVLFDANINAPPEYKEVFPGTTMLFDIRLFNLKSAETERATVTYTIKDLSNKAIISETESVTVDSRTTYTKSIKLPSTLGPGTYILSVESKSGNSVGTSSYIFEISGFFGAVTNIEQLIQDYFFSIVIGIAVLLLFVTAYGTRQHSGFSLGKARHKLIRKQKVLSELREGLDKSNIQGREKKEFEFEIASAERSLVKEFRSLKNYRYELEKEQVLYEKFQRLRRLHRVTKSGKAAKQNQRAHLKGLKTLRKDQHREFREKELALITLGKRLRSVRNKHKTTLNKTIRRYRRKKDGRSKALVQTARRKLDKVNQSYSKKEAERLKLLGQIRSKHSGESPKFKSEEKKVREGFFNRFVKNRQKAKALALARSKERARLKEKLRKKKKGWFSKKKVRQKKKSKRKPKRKKRRR